MHITGSAGIFFGWEPKTGLNRFDGYGFRVFRHESENPASLSGNDITVLLEGGTETCGLALSSTASIVSILNWKPLPATLAEPGKPGALPDNTISALYLDGKQRLWVGTFAGGLARLDPGEEQFHRLELNFAARLPVGLYQRYCRGSLRSLLGLPFTMKG